MPPNVNGRLATRVTPPLKLNGICILYTCTLLSISMWKTFCQENNEYSPYFLMQYEGNLDEAEQLGRSLGYRLHRKILDNFYEFVLNNEGNSTKSTMHVAKAMKTLNCKFKSFEQQMYHRRVKRYIGRNKRNSLIINDPLWNNQWELHQSQSPNMNVYQVWTSGFTGKGVTIAFLDDGIDTTHTDFTGNYNASLSYDYINSDMDPRHATGSNGHGTRCAGMAAAVRNTKCIIGIAYEATIAAVLILDDIKATTDSQETLALNHKLTSIDIYSSSWGPPDDGDAFYAIGTAQESALINGVKSGRNGKGVIYTWASGNGGEMFDDCNADGFANSIYTIAIGSVNTKGHPAYYNEQCTAIMVATFGGDSNQDLITTTGPNNGCVDDFEGTSAACPAASGIIALVLQANSSLSWRDIQHMIVEYSTTTGIQGDFYTNGASKQVSYSVGFGLMNAEALTKNANSWKSVGDSLTCSGAQRSVNKNSVGKSVNDSYTMSNCQIKYLEHVLISIDFKGSTRGMLEIYITSANGTRSRILRQRQNDISTSRTTWTFMSVHTWGEDPNGIWSIEITTTHTTNIINFYSWSLKVHGLERDPLQGTRGSNTSGEASTSATNNTTVIVIVSVLLGTIFITLIIVVVKVNMKKKIAPMYTAPNRAQVPQTASPVWTTGTTQDSPAKLQLQVTN